MTELLDIHPQNPQPRALAKVADVLRAGGIIIAPTDTGYSMMCGLDQKDAVARIRRARDLDKNHFFTLYCRNFAEVSTYARLNNTAFRFLKAHTPAPITFILQATKDVPKRLVHPKRRTIGVRIVQSKVMLDLLEQVGEPLMGVGVEPSQSDLPPLDEHGLLDLYQGQVDLIVPGTSPSIWSTTMVDLTDGTPEVVRQGCYHI